MRLHLLALFMLLFLGGCDTKEVGKKIAQQRYDELERRYSMLEEEYALKVSENRELSDENRALKAKIEAYKNGFKSMYQ